MRRPSARVSQQSFDEAALRRMSLQESKASEDIRNANADEQVISNCYSKRICMDAWLSQLETQCQVLNNPIRPHNPFLNPQHFLAGRSVIWTNNLKNLKRSIDPYLNVFFIFEIFNFSLKDLCLEVGNRPTRTSGTSWPNSTSRLTSRSVFKFFYYVMLKAGHIIKVLIFY